MTKFIALTCVVLCATTLHASPTSLSKIESPFLYHFISVDPPETDLFSCTVTRSQKYGLSGTDCDDMPVLIMATGTATATAATCEEANALAYLNAGYNAFMTAQASFLLITGDCQGPPEP